MSAFGRAAAALPGGHQALGGGGLAGWLIRLVLWRGLWRLILLLWGIRTFGPFLLILVVVALVSVVVLRRRRRRRRGGSTGTGSSDGPRDW
jgi:cobalamin synthase